MNKLTDLKNKIENIEVNYYYEEVYNNLYNAVIDYENETQDFRFDYIFEDIVSYDVAEDIVKYQLEKDGLVRIYYLMGNANFNNDIFRINGYGNFEDIDIDDLRDLKDRILEEIGDE